MKTVSPIHHVKSIPGQYWQWRGQNVYYVRGGEENRSKPHPPLLLVHGFGASTDHWRKNIHQLKEDFEVWAIDLLGFGRSAKPAWDYNGQLWQEQLSDFITQLIQRPTVVAGNSLGGYACLCVGANHPDKVAGVILLNSAGPFTDTTPQKPGLRQKITSWIFANPLVTYLLFQRLRNKNNIRKTLEKIYFDTSAITDQLVEDIYRPSCDKGAFHVFASVFKNPQGEKVDQLLKKLKSPLLVIWGDEDPWMKVQQRASLFRKYYPQLTEYHLQAGHCPHDEAPEKVNSLIKTWITQTLTPVTPPPI
ncbi:MAG: alpha/beta fold hydrolase [Geminocystis sp.]|nr:alpha/beta fold hydrolase [Geminocystis sp.]HIK37454.1 alpha/beta fold hydrolase [Geminocystis sp. M7585_C2015_104]MCS7147052.1 alpha/beta fold hydrolase [Geminocystis sp.]MCX8079300.1 alpha/beta fold hydrolase [Geminocystis sp.]MDW8115875.1 alpha/beta fold hydrolase [Geminocystis sp.]